MFTGSLGKDEVGAPILLPARFVRLVAERLLFAVADGLDVARGNTILHQRVARSIGAAVAERQVVFRGAALVAVAPRW